MNRSLKLSMLLLAALGSSQAMAMKLGQIEVKSALGQPLLAEIPVSPEGPADLRNLRVQMASNDDFTRAGITDGRTTVPLRFAVVNGPGNSKLIRITSAEAINDPFLDLLVEVDNASGKSVREFTILLDPPGRRSDSAAPIAARSSGSQQSRRSDVAETKPVLAPAPAPAPLTRKPPPTVAASVGGKFGPVKRGDTLTSIARQVSPAGVDINQMLLALKQSNPDAFYRDNVNALKSGAILRVPTAEQASAVSVVAALAEVRQQNGDWRAPTPGAPTRMADAAGGTPKAAATQASGDSGDHLALVPSKKVGSNAAAGVGTSGTSGGASQDLQRSEENVASLQQQSGELKSRVKDLQDINSNNQRLLALKNSEIADLQQQLAQARKAAGMPPATVAAKADAAQIPDAAGSAAGMPQAASAGPVQSASAPVSATTASASASSAPAATMASKPAAPTAAASVPVRKTVAQPAPTSVVTKPWYMQKWAWIAGAAVVLLLLLIGLRSQRRAPARQPAGGSLADRFDSQAVASDGADDDVDVDQEELLDQVAEHPDDIGLHLELASLYYDRRDVEHFESAAEAMYVHVTDPEQSEWQDVLAMGEDLAPSHPLFHSSDSVPVEDKFGADVDDRDALNAFDIDAYADTHSDDHIDHDADTEMPPTKVSEYPFDFNVSHLGRDPLPSPLAEPEIGSEWSDDDVSVDLPASDDAYRVGDPEGADQSDWSLDRSGEEPASVSAEYTAEPLFEESPEYRFEPTSDPADLGEFSDDPVDTKLDLARAYLDMGDSEGARAMLDEVVLEGSQVQRDSAQQLLAKLS